ncbi:hypothetical protein HB943_16145 [Listeria weihenstephanensis]|uniref:Lipoprotein n=1 Tax=Listeria weihenstephanensis TaxID=1006155 RepID=A0A841ZAE9_9LIST|nr:hypothetical protein [Listeria weihenstephanensis]MBC1502134.1 hypothetical protein [Listeria weihenstephanensis]
MKYLKLLLTCLAITLLASCGTEDGSESTAEAITTANTKEYYEDNDFSSVLLRAPEYSFDMPFTEDDHESVFGAYPVVINADVLGMKGVITSQDNSILSPEDLIKKHPEISKTPSTEAKGEDGKKNVTPNYSDNYKSEEPIHFSTIWEVRVTEILKDESGTLKVGDVIKISRVGLPSSVVNENKSIHGKTKMIMVLTTPSEQQSVEYFGLGPYDESYIMPASKENSEVYQEFKEYSTMNPEDIDVKEYDYQTEPPKTGR